MLLLLALPLAHAADVSTWRNGLDDAAGWEDAGGKSFDDIGEVGIRHKVIAGIDCLEGTTRAPLPPDQLLTAAMDINHQGTWSSWKVPVSARLSDGSDQFDYYQLLDNPSPVADRYWFARGTRVVSGADYSFRWEHVDPSVSYATQVQEVLTRYPGAVMTGVNVGDWTFTREAATTRVRYRICTDAGGSLPRWIGEIAAKTTLPTNVADIIREVRRRTQ